MIYGYARVSTKGQAKDGNSLEAQEKLLCDNGAQMIFPESFTGTTKDRPKLNELMGILKDGDTLMVTKLDRIARSTRDGLDIIEELISKGVTINILNMGKFDNSPSGKLMRTIFFAFAEFERDMIVERTGEGKAICRETKPDWREGRKQTETPDFEKFLKKQKDGELTVTECCKALKISRGTWYNRVAEVGV
jgi:DNA invertase Pin-like site-specific DNA recombinase